MKLLAKLAVIVLIIGGVLFAIGHAKGGIVYSSWYNGQLHSWSDIRNIGFSPNLDIENSIKHHVQDFIDDVQTDLQDTVQDIAANAPTRTENPSTPPASDIIQALQFDLGRGQYIIQSGAEFSVTGTGLEHIKTWTDESTWHVAYIGGADAIVDTNDLVVTITLPEQCSFDEVELNAGAATVTLGALTAQEIRLNIGAGTLQTGTLTTESLSTDIGAGQANIALAGSWTEYQYEIESGMGTVTANNDTLASGLGGEFSGGTGIRMLDLNVGMGSIALTTETY